MYLWVDQKRCDGCGGCSQWLAGMPEGGFGGLEVPKWFSRDLPEYLYVLEKICMSEAITLVHCVEIIRMEISEYGVLGVLRVNGKVYGNTLEPAYKINLINQSADHTDPLYWIKPYNSPKYGPTWRAMNGSDTDFEFYPGNFTEHEPGSVLVGESEVKLRGTPEHTGSANSGKTFRKFMNALKGVSCHRLAVREFF